MFCCAFMWKSGGEDLQGFYPVRPECQSDVPRTRFKSRAGKTLSARRWHAAFTEDGHLDMEKVLRRIQRGGIHPSIKGAVWEFLSGCYDPDSTFDERTKLRDLRREQYGSWKEECKNMVPVVGSGKYITMAVVSENGQPIEDSSVENQGWIVKTAVTDDRTLQWMLSLHQIADAFWCFERVMRRLRENFRATATSMGVQTQLGVLSQVIKTVDPRLHQHLEDLDGGEYLFAIRMLMVLFRREFSFLDALYLWELMWAMEYNPNMFATYEELENRNNNNAADDPKLLKRYGKFERKYVNSGNNERHSNTIAVFVVASVLQTKNKRLLKEAKGLDDVVQILGDIAGNLDAKKACKEALKIHEKFLKKANRQ
ncbi:hypothetical protein F2Q69_00040650 [Brassica cretica]|uniref:Rab-GAP TBC domain-containing protein n=1 Tax=Brassica cretica TaxID=69181 RepID=A0A8S9NIW1_BRACR|nr:hypothetical protein F2Q69_00040650 [Brassica cretica]